ncbi:MAG: hypothetical protein JSV56_07650 [Methanomassiliicoccales archaeon]|nr:MAG: hypothetical protein JSV56_07650 [Methanomassiliicoccales archaeon]
MKERGQSHGNAPGGGCEGSRKTAILLAVGLLTLLFVSAQALAGGGAGSGGDIATVDGGGAGSGYDGGGAGSGGDIPTVDGGGAGSGYEGGGAGSG